MAQMKNVSELNKLRVRLFIEAVLNEGRLELIDELIAADYVGHIPCAEPEVTGSAGVRQLVCQATAAPIPACTSRSRIRSLRMTAS